MWFFSSLLKFIFHWRIIALQYCVSFCHTSVWVSQRYTSEWSSDRHIDTSLPIQPEGSAARPQRLVYSPYPPHCQPWGSDNPLRVVPGSERPQEGLGWGQRFPQKAGHKCTLRGRWSSSTLQRNERNAACLKGPGLAAGLRVPEHSKAQGGAHDSRLGTSITAHIAIFSVPVSSVGPVTYMVLHG